MRKNPQARRILRQYTLLAILSSVIVAIAVLLSATQQNWLSSHSASAAGGGPEMALTVVDGGFCNGSACYAAAGEDFTLGVEVVTAPAAGYAAIQTFVDYGIFEPAASEDIYPPGSCDDGWDNGHDGAKDRLDEDCATVHLSYSPLPDADLDGSTTIENSERGPAREIVWPELAPVAAFRHEFGPGFVGHAGLTGVLPPFPNSTHLGTIVELEMSCPASPIQSPISLLPHADPIAEGSGSAFVEPVGLTLIVPKVGSITVNCVSPQSFPGDTDGDGCADAKELGTDVTLGGQRDWLDPWDFYDVSSPKDGVIDLLNDILGVVNHYAPTGDPPYDAYYDRGPSAGPNGWNLTEPDGVIDLLIDITGVQLQFGHDCN